jgi:hypothetical protein
MDKSIKGTAIFIHFIVCLLAATAEPTGEKSLSFYTIYYLITFVNLVASVVIINNHVNKNYHAKNATTPNRDRIS